MHEPELDLHQNLERITHLLVRRRWWVILTFCILGLLAIRIVLKLPDTYSSEATLIVKEPLVPQSYVIPTTTSTPADEFQSLAREVLSRSQLLAIIDEMGLYAKQKQRLGPEELAELMRRDMQIEPIDTRADRNDAFKIVFTANSPTLAQAVTRRLITLFIAQNTETQGARAKTTAQFVQEQLKTAERRLASQEQRLHDYRARHENELPEQRDANLQLLTDARTQLETTVASLNRARGQQVFLESSLNASLARLQSERERLLTRFTSQHPEVMKKDQTIAQTKALTDLVKSGAATIEALRSLPTPDDTVTAQLKSQLEANLAEIGDLSKEQQSQTTEVSKYEARVAVTPVREQELNGILRDYNLYKQDYTDMQSKELQSQKTTDLEEHKEGRQFRLVDPANLPVKPSGPKRLKYSAGGVGAALALGLALAFFIDARDRSFHREEDLKQRFALPLIAGIPVLLTPSEERAEKWRIGFEWLAGCLVTLSVAAAEYYVYRHG